MTVLPVPVAALISLDFYTIKNRNSKTSNSKPKSQVWIFTYERQSKTKIQKHRIEKLEVEEWFTRVGQRG